jgi:hypothetical protein
MRRPLQGPSSITGITGITGTAGPCDGISGATTAGMHTEHGETLFRSRQQVRAERQFLQLARARRWTVLGALVLRV